MLYAQRLFLVGNLLMPDEISRVNAPPMVSRAARGSWSSTVNEKRWALLSEDQGISVDGPSCGSFWTVTLKASEVRLG
jgi:hypothetical protein